MKKASQQKIRRVSLQDIVSFRTYVFLANDVQFPIMYDVYVNISVHISHYFDFCLKRVLLRIHLHLSSFLLRKTDKSWVNFLTIFLSIGKITRLWAQMTSIISKRHLTINPPS